LSASNAAPEALLRTCWMSMLDWDCPVVAGEVDGSPKSACASIQVSVAGD
jgi:hypothetical protein